MISLPEIFALGLLAYLLYKLIFNFFVPIFKTTRKVRQQFRNMRDAMNGNQPDPNRQNGSSAGPSSGKTDQHPSFDSIGEYIDFEEIKK